MPPGPGTAPGTRYTLPRDQVHPPGTRYTPQQTATVVDGTYPTAMHPCFLEIFGGHESFLWDH